MALQRPGAKESHKKVDKIIRQCLHLLRQSFQWIEIDLYRDLDKKAATRVGWPPVVIACIVRLSCFFYRVDAVGNHFVLPVSYKIRHLFGRREVFCRKRFAVFGRKALFMIGYLLPFRSDKPLVA